VIRGRPDPVDPLTEVDRVQVAPEDLLLRVASFELDGEQHLVDLAFDGLLGRQQRHLHVLLGDGRRALGDPAGREVATRGADHRFVFDAGVLEEPGVLGGEDRVDDDLRDVLVGDRLATDLAREFGDAGALEVVDGRQLGRDRQLVRQRRRVEERGLDRVDGLGPDDDDRDDREGQERGGRRHDDDGRQEAAGCAERERGHLPIVTCHAGRCT
jgi:hypothetical protein